MSFENYDDEDEDDRLDREMYVEMADDSYHNIEILRLAQETLSQSWFWRFYSIKTKLRLVRETYKNLKTILDT